MKPARVWPRTLAGRLALILFGGLLLAHALTLWWVLAERGLAMRTMMADYLARDVASSVAMLERLPAAERAAWLPRLARRNYRFVLGAPPAAPAAAAAADDEISRTLAAALAPWRPIESARDTAGDLRLQLRLGDGTPLRILLDEPRLRVAPLLLALLAAQLALLGALAWLAVRQATRPLQQLAAAADALDAERGGAPLPEEGPQEVARAAAAFNAMQRRIQEHLGERTRILAAVSHDLQTPLTRLTLRAELLEDTALRGKLLADLEAMQALVREGIAYARSAQPPLEPPRAVDLHALLDSLACDYTDAGHPVTLDAQPGVMLQTRPHALRRLVTNLVDNALKFAGAAEIELAAAAPAVRITVSDRGPGIPPQELDAVLQPFYRIEGSRSRATGGTGLGLAIAQQLAQTLGGRLALANRPGGGLVASLELPPRA